MKLFDAPRGTPYALRFFILERRGLSLDIQNVDTATLENRRSAYLKINARGTVPALQLDDGMTVITELSAAAEYLDEVAQGDYPSLFGSNAQERAETRMWFRRLDTEICQPVIEWWRDDPVNLDLFLGHRIPCPEARLTTKLRVNQALNQLENDLEGKTWLCGERFSAADILSYGLLWRVVVRGGGDWVLNPARRNVVAWWARIKERPASLQAEHVFTNGAFRN